MAGARRGGRDRDDARYATARSVVREPDATCVDDLLRERAIADDASLPIGERLAQLALVALRDGTWSALPGAESSSAFRTRAREALTRCAIAHAGERIAIVSHAGTINAMLAEVLGVARDFFFPIANASISRVRVGADRCILVSCNETAHLT